MIEKRFLIMTKNYDKELNFVAGLIQLS